MPEIKVKHVVSFSSEDKVHKAENLLKPETYRKWKCATPGEKNASVILQFEKASKIQSIDIGNEGSAFVEVLVGRSSDSINDFQVFLVASSFMSPLESRQEVHTNRVRMFGPEKLSPKFKDEKWDCAQIICTQPFNKNISYGLTFIKFHAPSEKNEDKGSNAEAGKATSKIGAFKLKDDDDDEDEESLLTVGSLFEKIKENSQNSPSTSTNKEAPSYASAILASSSNLPKTSPQSNQKRKIIGDNNTSQEPPPKKTSTLDKEHIIYKNILGDIMPETKKKKNSADKTEPDSKQENKNARNSVASTSKEENKKMPKAPDRNESLNKQNTNKSDKPKKKVPFKQLMKKVVFAISGFVNPLRSEIREKALEMGAKYKGDWDSSCTHLVCAFLNTPKYIQVRADDGIVVSKDWITDCYKMKTLLPWRSYMLGTYTKDTSGESDDTDEDSVETPRVKNKISLNGKASKNGGNSPSNNKEPENNPRVKHRSPITSKNVTESKDESETEDEDALQDYLADTDADTDADSDVDSGGDTEDELRKFESKAAKKMTKSPTNSPKRNSLLEKPDVSDLPLPELPNIFKQKHFFLFGKLMPLKQHNLLRFITAYNGVVDNYMSDKVKYVITDEKWDQRFEEALAENEDLIFVKPLWIFKCHEARKLIPYQPYIIIPDS